MISSLSVEGRSGNQWLSPIGCAMFTLGYQTSLSAKAGQYAAFVQHIVALAVVDSICKLPSFEVSVRLPVRRASHITCSAVDLSLNYSKFCRRLICV